MDDLPIRCHSCGHGYADHTVDGRYCAAGLGDSYFALPCTCPGFRWVPADGPAVGSYTDPPQRP